jgi:Fe(3+) dicitrate transport protein
MKQRHILTAIAMLFTVHVHATTNTNTMSPSTQLETVEIVEHLQPPETGPFLPDVEGAEIFAGKRTDIIDPDKLPRINNNNYRQVLAQTPGMVLAEETTPSVSIGTKGLPAHRMGYLQVMKDGIPIAMDMLGYSSSYYTPAVDAVKQIQIVRGGASLLYGPQPGGAFNYIMNKPPVGTPFTLRTINTVGSYNYYANFTEFGGTTGKYGYYGYYNRRQTDGFRQANSQWNLNEFSGTLVYGEGTRARTYLTVDAYTADIHEPGGLTTNTTKNSINYNTNYSGTSRLYDNLQLQRYAVSLIHENDLSERAFFSLRTWWSYFQRNSYRQQGGGFGTLPTGPRSQFNQIQNQQFYTFGLLPQLRYDYDFLGNTHTVTGGAMLYNNQSPYSVSQGLQPWATTGVLQEKTLRSDWYTSFFFENKFTFGKFSFIPAVRFENIWTGINEQYNVAKSKAKLPLGNQTTYAFVPLPGFGAEYNFNPWITAFGNASKSYRPIQYSQSYAAAPGVFVPNNLQPSTAWTYEAGFRGNPRKWLSWQTSYFVINFDNQIGNINPNHGPQTTIVTNIGNSTTLGWDNMLNLDFIGLADEIRGTRSTYEVKDGKKVCTGNLQSLVDTYGSLSFFGGYTLQNGQYTSGEFQGKTPQYTPDYILRMGGLYNWRDKVKLSLMSTFNGSSYANDNNTQQYYMPAYDVWDFTYEVNLYKDKVSVIGGINNLFDKKYVPRVTNTGLDPGMPRNWYAGVQIKF